MAGPPAPEQPGSRPLLRDDAVAAARRSLAEILDGLPNNPGVYIMRDRRNKVLYIGKAANLRARVRQYFQPNTGDVRDFVPLLESIVGDIETVLTSNEKEALLLENTLIKQHQPRFNVNLRDDKNYLVLRLDPRADWPRLEVGRRFKDDGAFYFGPYHSATSARATLRVVNRHFQLRTCTDHVLANRRRPCLQYQIRRCPAPCVLPVAREDYDDQVQAVRLFLEGKNEELLAGLRRKMKESAASMEFEKAALARDQVRALESSLESQNVVSADMADQDVVGYHREGIHLDIVVIQIRDGRMGSTRSFSFTGQEFPDGEILSTFLGLYYDLHAAPPDEVLLPFPISDADVKAEWLSELRRPTRGRKVQVLVPQRGPRNDLIELARKNAAATFASRRNAQRDAEEMLGRLQQRLRLANLPRVIECYDISHIQGTDTVASQVVFVDGKPDKTRYRTYKIRSPQVQAGSPDDFASMYEVLARRLRRAREEAQRHEPTEGAPVERTPWALPDLIVIDGGRGQLGMALAAARDVGIDTTWASGLPIIGLAKERHFDSDDESVDESPSPSPKTPPTLASKRPDRIFLPHAKDPILIRANSAEMFVLAQLRDEAHRFAVTFHRAQRKRRTLRSALADIAGIGETRRRALLRHFGSVRKIREASLEALLAVEGLGPRAARAVWDHFTSMRPGDEPDGTPVAVVGGDGPDVGEAAAEDALDSAFANLTGDVPEEDGAEEGEAAGLPESSEAGVESSGGD